MGRPIRAQESGTDILQLSVFQVRALSTPEECDLILLGGKGSGKTHLLSILPLRQAEQLGARCRALYLRLSHGGGREFELKTQELYATLYGSNGVRFNSQSGEFRFPNNATLTIDQLAEPRDYQKHMGKNYTMIMVDEVGEYGDLTLIDKVRASLRPPLGVQARMVLCGNPGGPNHGNLLKRFVAGTTPWLPRLDQQTGRHFIWCPSTYRDNPHIDQDEYAAQLRAACMNDPALFAAWLDGSFAVAKGAFFASVLDETRNMIEPWDAVPVTYGERWRSWISVDYGVAAPSCTLLFCESPGATGPDGRFYPRGSMIALDEFASDQPGNLNAGMGYGVARLSDEIRALCKGWKVRPDGCGDDSMFARGGGSGAASVAEDFQQHGVHLWPAKKGDRLSGWTRMRTLLAAAGSPDQPGLYVSSRCRYWWLTVPTLPRDPRRVEDLDSRGPDHGADAARYGCLFLRREVRVTDMYDDGWNKRRKGRHYRE